MPNTAKGFPSPAGSDDNVNHDSIKAVADRENSITDPKTAAQITALTTTDLWTGETRRQTDGTGSALRQQSGLYVYDGTAWLPAIGDGLGAQSPSPTLTALTANPAMGTSPTQAWDWWMLGDWAFVHLLFVWGTGSPTPGTGGYVIPTPVLPSEWASTEVFMIGDGFVRDVSTTTDRQVTVIWDPINDRATMKADGGTTDVTGATPLTLGAAGDSIKIRLQYLTA